MASIRTEPRSFNRYVARDLTTVVVTYLTHAALVRIDRATDQLEPELAESWERLPDRQAYRIKLRPGVQFSDGVPLTADDVVFAFRAIYDDRAASPLADSLLVQGKPLVVTKVDASTVSIRFPAPFSPGLRLIAGVPILPRHRLESFLDAGTFASAWGPSTPPAELVGLGPFRLSRYVPGQLLAFDRNPLYFGRDGQRQTPVLDHVVLKVIPDQDAERLELETGQIDCTGSELRPSDYLPLKRAADAGRITLTDAGPGLDGDLLWFNLTIGKAAETRSRWLQHRDFRRAVSQAVDRSAFVDTVYLGEAVPAYGVVSPGNRTWYRDVPSPYFDPTAAARLLTTLGLTDRDHDGTREDPRGAPARFTLLTQTGNTALERGAFVLRDSLGRLGVKVDVVPLEVGALVDRFSRGDYDAVYFRLLASDADPALNPDFWLSSGSAHVWNPSQPSPSTDPERRIDTLMGDLATLDDQAQRSELFAQVQRIMAEELPVLCFAFPRMRVAVSSRVLHATPVAFRPPVLWNPAVIAVRDDAR